jgi:hypothetical protein
MRQRKGRTLPFVFNKESEAIPTIRSLVAPGSSLHADEASGWDSLHAYYKMHRVNHSIAYSMDGACTNQAESYFSRLRRAEIGTHHRIGSKYLGRYASEMAWREDHRREPNGSQFKAIVSSALALPVSREWRGYWQRRA